MEERVMLAEALWSRASKEEKAFIRKYNDERIKATEEYAEDLKTLDARLDAITDKYRAEVVSNGIMTTAMFEALDLAYTILEE